MNERDVYAELGVKRVLNAATTLTALGGSVLAPGVTEAMASASRSCVSIDELQLAVSRRLAQITKNEDAYVTSGCAAAIALSVLAAITKGRPESIARLPQDETLARNVVIHRAHRIPYDRAIELGGGHLVEVGNVIQTFTWEMETAIDERTACVVWVAGRHLPQTTLSLEETVAIAHARGVPVIVDAAAQLPPVSNLWHFTRECGADVALFSGGKALQGPQSSGLMVGSTTFLDAVRQNASPNQRLARAMKVGKEEICGLLASVERYVTLDHERVATEWEETIAHWIEGLEDLGGVDLVRHSTNEAGQPVPRLEVVLEQDETARHASDVVEGLWAGSPRVAVLAGGAMSFFLTPDTLVDDDAAIVLHRVRAALRTNEVVTTKEPNDVE